MQSKESSVLSERERNRTTDKDKMRLTVCRTELQTIPLSPLSLKSDLRMEKHECVSFSIHYDWRFDYFDLNKWHFSKQKL